MADEIVLLVEPEDKDRKSDVILRRRSNVPTQAVSGLVKKHKDG